MTRWLPLLVRLEDYKELAALVAQREAGRGASEAVTHRADGLVAIYPLLEGSRTDDEELFTGHQAWNVEDLERLAEGTTATTERWSRAMDVCAQEPTTWLTTSEVARRAGMSVNEWRDAPRKITRHLRVHYPNVPRQDDGQAEWPLLARGINGPIPGEVSWAITEEMARRWHQVRGEG